jgi:hypothetical protein
MSYQSPETDQSSGVNEPAPKAPGPKAVSLIARLSRRGELAPPGNSELNVALSEAAARSREHWLGRERSEYHAVEYEAARDELSSYRKDVLRTVELVVLAELSLGMMGTDTIPGKNPARRKKILLAHLYLGLKALLTHFSTRRPPRMGSK